MRAMRERYEDLKWLEAELSSAIDAAEEKESAYPFAVGTAAARKRLEKARRATWARMEALLEVMADARDADVFHEELR